MAEPAATATRAERVAEQLRERGLDALLVEDAVDVRYLTGFSGSNGLALIAAAGGHRFLTDFRYRTQSAEQVDAGFEREIVTGELIDAAAAGLPADGGRLGFDEGSLT